MPPKFNHQPQQNNLEETADKIIAINRRIWHIMGRLPLLLALFLVTWVILLWGPVFLAGVIMKTLSKKG